MTDGPNLQEIFPEMKPTKKPPAMFSINGIGVSVYGKRDFHAETHTYVKTLCACIVFIPIFPIKSYRVLDASSKSWYFLGTVPLSSFAKWWRRTIFACLLFIIGSVAVDSYFNSPEYRAKVNMAEAKECLEQNKTAEAVELFNRVADGYTSYRDSAQQNIADIVNGENFISLPIDNVISIMKIAQGNKWRKPYVPLVDLYHRGEKVFELSQESHPKEAIKLLNYLIDLAPEHSKKLDEKRILVLENIVKLFPDEISFASELAVIYEKQQKWQACYELLEPRAKKLGTTEGARILGQIYSSQGNLSKSYALLEPYVTENLQKLHRAEKEYKQEYEKSYERALSSFQTLYRYNRTLTDQQLQNAFIEYLAEYRKKDTNLLGKLDNYREATSVVHVAMDLGLVKLHIARSSTDAKFREKELKETEKIFLDIQGVAGGQEKYKLTLGQVYYWLGNQEKGQQLFDELLAQTNREPRILIDLVDIMRALGKNQPAYELAKEAYGSSKDKDTKDSAAMLCSLIVVDNTEKIEWLKKSDTTKPFISAMLNSALGEKALAEKNYEEAKKYIRKTIQAYEKQEQSVYTINNLALEYYSLFNITHDIKELEKTVQLLDSAVALSPQDSIVLSNAQMYMYQKAIYDVVHDKIDASIYNGNLKLDLLSFLYNNEKDKAAVLQSLEKNPWFQKSLSHLRKLIILAPDKVSNYTTASDIFRLYEDTKEMENLLNQLVSIQKYLPDNRESSIAIFSGISDSELAAYYTREINYYANLVKTKEVSATSSSIANAYVVFNTVYASMYGAQISPQKTLIMAQNAYKQNPSESCFFTYIEALEFQAHTNLLKQKKYEAIASKCQRSLTPHYILLHSLNNDSSLQKVITMDKNVQVAVKLCKDYLNKFPRTTSLSIWALLHVTSPNEAKKIANNIQSSKIKQQENYVDRILHPMKGSAAMQSYWLHSVLGDMKTANKIWQDYVEKGLPLPQK